MDRLYACYYHSICILTLAFDAVASSITAAGSHLVRCMLDVRYIVGMELLLLARKGLLKLSCAAFTSIHECSVRHWAKGNVWGGVVASR